MTPQRRPLLAPALCALAFACTPSASTGGAAHAVPPDTVAERLIAFSPPAGWQASEQRDPDGHPIVTAKSPSGCTVTIDTWSSLPPSPGGVMSIASTRKATVDGKPVDVVKTSMFAGQADEVEGVFVNDGKAYGRIIFRACTVDEANGALAHVTFSSSLSRK